MNKCFKCGAEFEGNFCPECGTKFEVTKTCPQCNTQLDGQARFCNNCGFSFVETKSQKKAKAPRPAKKKSDILQKSKAWLIAHKTLAIIVATVLLVGIVLAIVLPLTVGNPFYIHNVDKINLGDDYERVEKILGEPYKSTEYAYIYYSKNIIKKMEQLRDLEENVDLDSLEKWEDLEKLYEQIEKLEAEINSMDYKCINVTFSNGEVTAVELNTHAGGEKSTQLKWQENGGGKQKIVLSPSEAPYGSTPNMIQIVAKIYYNDGSYRMSVIRPISEGDVEYGWTLTWSDNWGKYSSHISANSDTSNIVDDTYWYQVFKVDEGKYVIFFIENTSYFGSFVLGWEDFNVVGVYVSPNVTTVPTTFLNSLTDITFEQSGNCVYLGSQTNPYQSLWKVVSDDVTSVTIHPDTQTIMDNAFAGCENLTDIDIPDSVTRVGEGAFANCSNLRYNEYEGVNYLGGKNNPYRILVGPTSYYSVTTCTMHDNTEIVLSRAFAECTSLESVTLSTGIKSIGNQTFYMCRNLMSVTIPDGVQKLGSESFYGCSSLTSISIPNSVQCLEYNLFYGCSKLTNLTFGSSLVCIEYGVFGNCNSLANVYYRGSIANWCHIEFNGESSNPLFKGANLIIDNANVIELAIPNSVTEIGKYAFVGGNFASVTIPSSVKAIGAYAFYNCNKLTDIIMANGVEEIGEATFGECSSLTNVTLSEKLQFISNNMFYGCSSLVNITIPNSVTYIGSEAFCHCTGLTDITLSKNIDSIGSYAFYNCASLKSIVLPSSLTLIEENAFYFCTNLTSVTFHSPKAKTHWTIWLNWNNEYILSSEELADSELMAYFLTEIYYDNNWYLDD